jgi:hypothetical protein
MVATITITMLAGTTSGQAAVPIKELPSNRLGHEVNLSQVNAHAGAPLEDSCTPESGDTCQAGTASTITGGFTYPSGVAGTPEREVYVTDNNERVQELGPNGEFILMFGKDVNETTGANICTAASHDACKTGVEGTGPGEFNQAKSVAVDQGTGNVYVEDFFNYRVQEFTAAGEFVVMFGQNVNETKEKEGAPQAERNMCSEQEIKSSGVKCHAGVRSIEGSTEPGVFKFAQFHEGLLAVGPGNILYVGDEHRVQEFEANGKYKTEIPLSSIEASPGSTVTALAVDGAGNTYLAYRAGFASGTNVVRVFNAGREEIKNKAYPLTLAPISQTGAPEVQIGGIATDLSGRLAVTEREVYREEFGDIIKLRATLYAAATAKLISEFTNPDSIAIAFDGHDDLYAAARPDTTFGHEVWVYGPVSVAELVTGAETCVPGGEHETDVTIDCTLNGKVDPEGVSETGAWFQWGRSQALGEMTGEEKVEEPSSVHAVIEGLRPNDTVYYRLAGDDHNVRPPELLAGETVAFLTPTVAPRILGTASALFVKASSAVLFGELNPEHGSTEYEFQYGACASLDACTGMIETVGLESAVYGKIGTTREITGLQPDTTYRYRLVATNRQEQEVEGAEREFTTGPAPMVQAFTGVANGVGATSAVISGTVNPDGQAATYAFELGIYEGAQTQYGIVFSGPAGSGRTPIGESVGLFGLQPGTTYAYRIRIKSGYGEATGEPVTFTTEGLPSVLVSPTPLAMLTIPSISFPKTTIGPKTKKGKTKKKKVKKVKKSTRSTGKKSNRHKPHKGKR